jgi:hypothetical protein
MGLIFFYSCKKANQPQTTVEGVVSNKLTGEFVKNIPIEIIECDGWPQKCVTAIQTIYTDANGHYKTAFVSENRKAYKIAVGLNNTIASSPYPYYNSISKNIDNTINFSQFPLKILQLHFKILRHDKNWLQTGIQACDGLGFYANDFYFGTNPTNDFDTTYQIKIEAGRQYRAHVGLSNKIADNTYQNNEFIYNFFAVNNIDTTKIDFIVQ